MKYRNLKQGELLQKGDEFLCDDAETWKPIIEAYIGQKYSFADFAPIRRPIEGGLAPEQKTITVRIAVAVDPAKKEWNCAGWKLNGQDEPADQVKIDYATEEMFGERQIYFVTAVIPITEPPVIVGRVTEGE